MRVAYLLFLFLLPQITLKFINYLTITFFIPISDQCFISLCYL